MAATFSFDDGRVKRLTDRLLSDRVQVPLPESHEDVSAKFSDDEIKKVFRDHVPGVEKFLFRGKPGQYSLNFIANVYRDGLRAFEGTPVHLHLRSLLRFSVHRGAEAGKQVAEDLRELAEGFMDCQAVQARTIEKVGLRLSGERPDFPGLLTKFVGEYKHLAIRILAQDRLDKGFARDYDDVHTHYENRLTADLGDLLGLDADSVRLAQLDEHAENRYGRVEGEEAERAAGRCRELFDVREVLQGFVAEVNSFSEATFPDSLARRFLSWANERMTDQFVVLDEETCSRTAIDTQPALAVFEALYFGAPAGASGETYRGQEVNGLFHKVEIADAPERRLQQRFLPPSRARAAAQAAFNSNAPAEAAQDGSCASSGCGRQAAPGFPHCCRTCRATAGAAHGPVCEERALAAMLAASAEAAAAASSSSSSEALPADEEGDQPPPTGSTRRKATERRRKLKESRQRRQRNARASRR